MYSIIGIGAQKSGSSWVYNVLCNHPALEMSVPKELDFFTAFYDRGYEWYESHVENYSGKMLGEISPSYFYDSDAPERVFRYNPNAKIILCLRDPVKRLISNHFHEVRAGHVTGDNILLENALKNNPAYILQSKFSENISRWLRWFGVDQLHIVLQERISSDPQSVYVELCEFLSIQPEVDTAILFEKVNESREYNNKLVGKVLSFSGDLLRKVGATEMVARLKDNSFVSNFYQSNLKHYDNIVPRPSDAVMDELNSVLADELRMYSLLTNGEFPYV